MKERPMLVVEQSKRGSMEGHRFLLLECQQPILESLNVHVCLMQIDSVAYSLLIEWALLL